MAALDNDTDDPSQDVHEPTSGNDSASRTCDDSYFNEAFVRNAEVTVRLMEQLAEDRAVLAQMPDDLRHRLLKAAGRVAYPGRNERRRLTHGLRERRRAEQRKTKEQDDHILEQTGIRARYQTDDAQAQIRFKQYAGTPTPLPTPDSEQPSTAATRLQNARNCYVCKNDYVDVHFFYDALCPSCAERNWEKRNQTYDLSGRVAIVTGARVKIGFEAALKLLRAGATVVVTTRFPNDAADRYARESDHDDWKNRLIIHGIDLRHTPSVESLADHLLQTLPRLDFILNNACQTVRRPPGFYAHLMDGEQRLSKTLRQTETPSLESHRQLMRASYSSNNASLEVSPTPDLLKGLTGIQHAAVLSQLVLTDEDANRSQTLFPEGKLDVDAQQVDLRDKNSWRLKLTEVSTVELLEVQLVNSIAPFILNARLKPLMQQVPSRDKHIVNVSAMEGIFYRAYKTDKHPHTNMAKAALNMLTRTSAQDYIKDGIHMNSVDTGWITDEDPAQIAARKKEQHGFHPPLDIIDGAARICDPIFAGLLSGEHVWGQFLKDYDVSNW